MSRTRITKLSAAERTQLKSHADKWIEIGLRTGPADRPKFEAAARKCYEFTGLEWPDRTVWVSSPLVLAFAAPAAAFLLALSEKSTDDLTGRVCDAVTTAIAQAMQSAPGTVSRLVQSGVCDAVANAVGLIASDKITDAVRSKKTRDQTEINKGLLETISSSWYHILGGQFWVGGWFLGGAWTSFFREVCKLDLPGDLWERSLAYEATMESTCWWWPHREFIMVCERPLQIHCETVAPTTTRENAQRPFHRLHCDNGPAIVWPDGWGIWAIHGVRVPPRVVEEPDSLTTGEILAEENVEIRRVMLERAGYSRLLDRCKAINHDDYGKLWQIELGDDTRGPALLVEKVCPSTGRVYVERVDPGVKTARGAIAWQAGLDNASSYSPVEA